MADQVWIVPIQMVSFAITIQISNCSNRYVPRSQLAVPARRSHGDVSHVGAGIYNASARIKGQSGVFYFDRIRMVLPSARKTNVVPATHTHTSSSCSQNLGYWLVEGCWNVSWTNPLWWCSASHHGFAKPDPFKASFPLDFCLSCFFYFFHSKAEAKIIGLCFLCFDCFKIFLLLDTCFFSPKCSRRNAKLRCFKINPHTYTYSCCLCGSWWGSGGGAAEMSEPLCHQLWIPEMWS